jgi:DNA-binding SARP family transcriptional activator
MRVRLLGPVDVLAGGIERPVSGLRRKAVLATLALRAGEIVSADRLSDIVWGKDSPSIAPNTLQSHVSYLRTVLGSKIAIRSAPPGYVLDLAGDGTDVRLAERLLRDAAALPDPVRAVGLLREALALWRGKPLADVPGISWLEDQTSRLDLLRTDIRLALTEARLATGEHALLVPDLTQLVAEQPLDERVHAQLMLALYRSGRQADALAAFHQLRATLDEQLGIDPSQRLRDLELAILRQDVALDLNIRTAATVAVPPAGAAGQAGQEPAEPVPAQLPPAVHVFAGRGAELASLDSLLANTGLAGTGLPGAGLAGTGLADAGLPRTGDDGQQATSCTVVISAIAGTAGVGKTALALHWAHRVREHFPDGQLYVNLRAFDPGRPPLDPEQALDVFFDALSVPQRRIPAGIAPKAGLFRSLLNGKRMLVFLDNALDSEQVRPLLPGSPGCLALVTSRNQLTGLIAAEGAHPMELDLLTAAEARDLLARRLGPHRVGAEPDAVEELIAACARLPLALTLVAARAAARPNFALCDIADELYQSASPLDEFDGGERTADIRAVFACSYRALSPGAARMFRLLGLHPGPDSISAAAAASLAGLPSELARSLLSELTRAHLLSERAPAWYAMHDLLSGYAAEQADIRDTALAREAALRRLFDHFLHTAYSGTKLAGLSLAPFPLAPAQPGVTAIELATTGDAHDWFRSQYCTLLSALSAAADAGLTSTAWQLAWTLTGFQLDKKFWQDHPNSQRTGLDPAQHGTGAAGKAHALLALAIGYTRAGRHGEAAPLFARTLRIFEEVDDPDVATIGAKLRDSYEPMIPPDMGSGLPVVAVTMPPGSLEFDRAR